MLGQKVKNVYVRTNRVSDASSKVLPRRMSFAIEVELMEIIDQNLY